ncbi:MAG: 30S ribosomal protein S16 [Candidatus Woesebacteria bacterium]
MVKIKLSRTGKKNEPHFRIVVVEARSKRDGEYVENVGNYHPKTKQLVLNKVSYDAWIAKGAQPTETVASLVKKYTPTV